MQQSYDEFYTFSSRKANFDVIIIACRWNSKMWYLKNNQFQSSCSSFRVVSFPITLRVALSSHILQNTIT